MQKALISSRNKYNIPPVGLTFDPTAPNGPTEIYQEFTFGTSLELDLHHHHLLQSDNEQEVLLGIYSTIYWSQYAFLSAEERPRTIDDFLALLPPAISAIKPTVAATAMKNAITDLKHEHHALALIEINKLLRSNLSTASNILAFLDPENIGVFDDKLITLLTSGEWNIFLGDEICRALTRPQTETLNDAANRFALYCTVLGKIKHRVNQSRIGWKDPTGSQMLRFRSIDVQRALNAMGTVSEQTY